MHPEPPAPVAGSAVTIALARLVLELDGLVAEQGAQGERLVAAVVGQVADGQVEVLRGLQSAAASVRRHSGLLEDLARGLGETADQAVARVSTAVSDDLGNRVAQLVSTLTDVLVTKVSADVEALTGRLAEAVDTSTRPLRAEAAASAQQILTQLRHTEVVLTESAEAGLQRTEQAGEALTWAADELTARVGSAAELLGAQSASAEDALRSAGEAVAEQLRLAGADAEDRVVQAADLAVARIEAAVVAADTALAAVLEDLRAVETAQRRRDTDAARRLDARVAKAEAAVVSAAALLEGQVGELADRDARLEAERAEQFARVLSDVLGRSAGGRGLLGRVRKALDEPRPPAQQPPQEDQA